VTGYRPTANFVAVALVAALAFAWLTACGGGDAEPGTCDQAAQHLPPDSKARPAEPCPPASR